MKVQSPELSATTQAPTSANDGQSFVLPQLRAELRIIKSSNYADGAPSFLVIDPLSNRNFRIDQNMLELLSIWQPVEIEAFELLAMQKTGREISSQEIQEAANFVLGNQLSIDTSDHFWKKLYQHHKRASRVTARSLLQRLFFIKFPLGKPEPFLNQAWPWVAPFFTRTFAVLMAFVALMGLMLVSRQWDDFVSTFVGFLTPEGLFSYLLAIGIIKVIHELGHAFMAKKYGVRVSEVGVALMFFMPILYTETSDAWKLTDRRKRLMIDLGGIFAELATAAIATLAWVFMPDGTMRSIVFVFATLSWITSLVVNLNPLMRFDGYYIMSDFLGLENLQQRSFAFARWKIRKILFGLNLPPPEAVERKTAVTFTLFAIAAWIYRFFLYLGVAILFYFMSFKLVGAAIFIAEIVCFICLPIANEMQVWWGARTEITKSRNSWLTALALFGLILLLVLPWSGRVDVPVMVEAGRSLAIYPGSEGQLVQLAVSNGQPVKTGDLLFQIHSQRVEQQWQMTMLERQMVDARLARIAADSQSRSLFDVLQREKSALDEKLAGIARQRDELSVHADFDGIVRDVLPGLSTGQYVMADKPILTLVGRNMGKAIGLVDEAGSRRMEKGDIARFIPDVPGIVALDLKVEAVGDFVQNKVEPEILADINGGRVDTWPAGKLHEPLKPRGSWYAVELSFGDKSKIADTILLGEATQVRGLVVVDGRHESYLSRMARQVAMVLVREFSF